MIHTPANKRWMLGYWHERPTDGYAHPQPLVDHGWDSVPDEFVAHGVERTEVQDLSGY
jgi:hypothetical protein